jgi:hypothetical protein
MSPSPGGVGVNKKPPYTIAGWYSLKEPVLLTEILKLYFINAI